MQTAKKILLSLIFSCSISSAPVLLLLAIINTVNPSWLKNDQGTFPVVASWVITSIFILAAFSSIYWLKNFRNTFWLWKIPALLIFPFSIPFLILDFIEWRRAETIVEKPLNQKTKSILILVLGLYNLQSSFFTLVFSLILGYVSLKSNHSDEVPLALVIPFCSILLLSGIAMLIGSLSMIINFYYPKRVFYILSYFGYLLNWIYLFLIRIDQKDLHYFFKHEPEDSKPTSPSITLQF